MVIGDRDTPFAAAPYFKLWEGEVVQIFVISFNRKLWVRSLRSIYRNDGTLEAGWPREMQLEFLKYGC